MIPSVVFNHLMSLSPNFSSLCSVLTPSVCRTPSHCVQQLVSLCLLGVDQGRMLCCNTFNKKGFYCLTKRSVSVGILPIMMLDASNNDLNLSVTKKKALFVSTVAHMNYITACFTAAGCCSTLARCWTGFKACCPH